MPAQLKVYNDASHISEVTHTANISTTLSGATIVGATSLVLTSTVGMPPQGYIDIDSGGNFETIPYTLISGSTLTLAKACAFAHASGVAVIQWYYLFLIGDQVSGIINDGTMSTPNSPTNVGTWYLYNAGDQIAQNVILTLSNVAPTTTNGYADTVASFTSFSTGFSASPALGSLAVGAVQQFWLAEQIPLGQNNIPSLQVCVLNMNFQTV